MPLEKCRELAVEILLKVEKKNAYAYILLDHSLKKASLSSRDRALLTHLVYGALRWRGRIDWYLSQFLHRSLSGTNAYIRNLLRLTLYQLLFLDKVPDYAAVNEGVELAKRHGGARAGGLVNGVVRRILREKDKLLDPDPKDDAILYLSVRWSHPDWLVKKWLGYFGREKLRARGFNAAPTRWSPQGIQLKSAGAADRLPGFQEGFFQVQGEASQLIGYLVDPQPGERVLDACAAPGGKTTHLAELMGDNGELIVTDISVKGLEKLKQNVQRLGLTSVRPFAADVSRGLTGALALPYDRILVDAPCSGLGTLRSHPEAKWQKDERDIRRLSKLQKKIVRRLSSYLKPGGILVYATCTLTREENEGVVEDFLDQEKGFVLDNAQDTLPREAKPMISGKYFLALPHKHNTDGFFAARMRKVK